MSIKPDSNVSIDLLKDEIGGLSYEYGITTLTIFEGDYTIAGEVLEGQLFEVVKANSWLAGHLTKDKKLAYDEVVTSREQIKHIFISCSSADSDAKLKFLFNATAPYVDTCTAMYKSDKIVVGAGYQLFGKDLPLTRLTVVESTTPGTFGVIFSISHTIVDGHTYYDILKMLQPGSGAVRSLDIKRIHTFSETMKDAYNRKALDWADSMSAACFFMPTMLCGSAAKCYAFQLDDEKVEAAKKAGAVEGGVQYVTTNDVITSAFFNVTKTRIGWMGLDCRDKLNGFGSNLAGNYVTALVIDDEVFATPSSLRLMYSSGKPLVTTKRPLPGCCCTDNSNVAMVTNWSSFDNSSLLSIENCKLSIHIPVQNPAHCVFNLMIPFVTSPGKKGVICWVTNTDENQLRAALPVGETVSSTLFPTSLG